jgi:hypothetical protein
VQLLCDDEPPNWTLMRRFGFQLGEIREVPRHLARRKLTGVDFTQNVIRLVWVRLHPDRNGPVQIRVFPVVPSIR